MNVEIGVPREVALDLLGSGVGAMPATSRSSVVETAVLVLELGGSAATVTGLILSPHEFRAAARRLVTWRPRGRPGPAPLTITVRNGDHILLDLEVPADFGNAEANVEALTGILEQALRERGGQ